VPHLIANVGPGDHVERTMHVRMAADLHQLAWEADNISPGKPGTVRVPRRIKLRRRQIKRRLCIVSREEVEDAQEITEAIVEGDADDAGVRVGACPAKRVCQSQQFPAIGT
jgi:hypothetical protein